MPLEIWKGRLPFADGESTEAAASVTYRKNVRNRNPEGENNMILELFGLESCGRVGGEFPRALAHLFASLPVMKDHGGDPFVYAGS